MLVNADLAMYDAKEAGRNQIALHVRGEHAQARMSGRITWAERIRVAIDEDRFAHVAQPIFDLATGAMTQFEVLLRMRDDARRPDPAGRVPVDRRAARDDPADRRDDGRAGDPRGRRRTATSAPAGRASRSTSRARRWATRRCCA